LRQQAIEAWLPLAHQLARRYRGRGEHPDDLRQVAIASLIESVDRFEPDRGADFPSYAVPTVLGAIKRHFRDRCWSVRVPRRLQERWLLILSVNDSLTQRLRRAPGVPDIAAHLHISEEEVVEGLQGARVYHSISLSAPHARNRDAELGEFLGSCDRGYELAELRMALRDALTALEERDRVILSLRFYGNLTQKEIGERLGMSQMHVSRLLTAALHRLRHLILETD
jgi:RNA polymerase sigma-B factor